MAHFQHLTFYLFYTGNIIWVYEICKSLRSLFIDVLDSVPASDVLNKTFAFEAVSENNTLHVFNGVIFLPHAAITASMRKLAQWTAAIQNQSASGVEHQIVLKPS